MDICLECLGVLIPPYNAKRQFCSLKCKDAWHNRLKRIGTLKTVILRNQEELTLLETQKKFKEVIFGDIMKKPQ